MGSMRAIKIFFASILFLASTVFGQNVLTNDTLYIGCASGHPGEQVVVPIHIKISGVYQGWQIPLRFGDGTSPLHCDSVSIANSCMSSIPHEWDFIAPFMNNNEWNNAQRCGIAGVVDMAPPYEWLPPGGYVVMDLYFTIAAGAQPQVITLDTATSAWYNGGPQNAYAISQNYQSWLNIVKSGSVEILATGIADHGAGNQARGFMLFPSHVSEGQALTLAFSNDVDDAASISVLDASGRVCQRLIREKTVMRINTNGLPSGAYFVVVLTGHGREAAKFIVD